MKETIAFEDYIEKKPKKTLGIFKKKEKIIKKPIENLKELSDLEKLEREIEEKKKLLEIKKLEEKLKKNEELLRLAEKEQQDLDTIQTEEQTLTPLSSFDVPLSSQELRQLKRCPKCNKKLFRNKVKQVGYNLSQVLKCKSPTCDFYKELKFQTN